jgi:hypothetical protein
VLRNGDLLDLFWTYDSQEHRYRTIHAKRSTDCGASWSADLDTGIPGQPAQVVSLPSGQVALPYVDRTGSPQINMRFSDDHGASWPQSSQILLHESGLSSQTLDKVSMADTWTELGQYSMGLPQSALLTNGGILVVYYAGERNDLTDILWSVVRP